VEASVKLGRIASIPFGIHLSWFLIVLLVTWAFATSFLPEAYPGLPGAAYWLLAACTGLLYFASVLVHECAHAVAATREGIPVVSINLFVFGGVARIDHEPATAGAEFRLSIAGPLASLILAGFFLAVHQVSRPASYLATPCGYLAFINLLLALYNLIPGFPLDGGRVLRSLVWKISGDYRRATSLATKAGRIVAYVLMALGGLSLFRVLLFEGLLLIFSGWFLQNAAASAGSQADRDQEPGADSPVRTPAQKRTAAPGAAKPHDIDDRRARAGAAQSAFVERNERRPAYRSG